MNDILNKPNCREAMLSLLQEIRVVIPFNLPQATICGGKCQGCPKKMLEMLDTEVCYWESMLSQKTPGLADLNNLVKLARRTHKVLVKNQLIR